MKIELTTEEHRQLYNFIKHLMKNLDHRNFQTNIALTPTLIATLKRFRIDILAHVKCYTCGKRAHHILHIDKDAYPTPPDYIAELDVEFPLLPHSMFVVPHYWCVAHLPEPRYKALAEIHGVNHTFL